MEEIFKEHPIYKDWYASNYGEIANADTIAMYSNESGFRPKLSLSKQGYLYLMIKGKRYFAHRFIYECFNGLIPEGLQIDYIDTIKTNNTISNLRAVTAAENNANPLTALHKKTSSRMKLGKSVLKKDKQTGEILGYYESVRQAAEENNTQAKYIRWACEGKEGYYSAAGFKWEWAKYRYSCKWGKWWISGDL